MRGVGKTQDEGGKVARWPWGAEGDHVRRYPDRLLPRTEVNTSVERGASVSCQSKSGEAEYGHC